MERLSFSIFNIKQLMHFRVNEKAAFSSPRHITLFYGALRLAKKCRCISGRIKKTSVVTIVSQKEEGILGFIQCC